MSRRRILCILATVLVLVAIAAWMMVIGRGHTVYFDNKSIEYEGQKYDAIRRINVNVNGEQVAKLSQKERGMAICTGSAFSFDIEVIREKGGDSEFYSYDIPLPYSTDGIIVNLIGMIEGLPQEACLSEFVPTVVVEEDEGESVTTDEFDMGGDI